VLLSLSTGHTIGLLLVAGGFMIFALLCSLVVPRRWPDFPGTHMGWFIVVALVFFVGTLFAVNFFGVEAAESEAAGGSTPAETQPATTGATTTGATTTSAAPAGDATQGKALYTSLGCVGCHSLDGSKGTGPTFKGLFGAKEKLANGQTVTADAAYLLESILDPDKQIVAGYPPGIMSAVIKPHAVSQADAQELVDYIKSIK
jgi:mono/diheme cytochrome c family protein